MLIREHRELLTDAMTTVVEVEPTRTAVHAYVNEKLKGYTQVQPEDITLIRQGFDARIGWDSYAVYIAGYGMFGYANGPLAEDDVMS